MRLRRSWLPVVLAAAAFLPLASAQPQSQAVYTFIADWQVPRAQWAAFTEAAMKNTVPVLERLVADGTLIEFAITASVVHLEEGPTHTFWWAADGFADLQRALGELLKVTQFQSAEFSNAKHRDRLLRSVIYESPQKTKLSSGFGHLSVNQIQPGKAQQWRSLFDKYTKPVYDKLLADGVILGYGVDQEWIHTEAPGARYTWYLAPNAEAVDKVNAATAAAQRQSGPAVGQAFGEVMVPGSHRDSLDRILYYVHK